MGKEKTKKWRARYRRDEEVVKIANSFGLRFSAQLPNDADVVTDFPVKLNKFFVGDIAKVATPAGYIFIGVEEVKDF